MVRLAWDIFLDAFILIALELAARDSTGGAHVVYRTLFVVGVVTIALDTLLFVVCAVTGREPTRRRR